MDLWEKAVYVVFSILPISAVMLLFLVGAFWLHWAIGIAFFVLLWYWVASSYWHEWANDLRQTPRDPRKPNTPEVP